jgi:chitodextrinase
LAEVEYYCAVVKFRVCSLGKGCAVAVWLVVAGCAYGGSQDQNGAGDDGGDGSAPAMVDSGRDAAPDSRPPVDSSTAEGGDDASGGDATGDDAAANDASGDSSPMDAADAMVSTDASEGGLPVDASDGGSAADASDAGALVDARDTTPPTVPTGLSRTMVTGSSISLSWSASTDPDSAVAGYNVYRGGTKVGTSTSTSYTDTGLASGTIYGYTVSAFDPSGNTSAQSSPVSVQTLDTTAPTVPTGLTQTAATTTTISLNWTASTDTDSPVAGYNIYRRGVIVGTSTSTSFTDTGLTPSTGYVYTVSAYDPSNNTSAQSAAYAAVTGSPVDTTPPSVPTGLVATGATTTSITLGWTASTDPDSPVAGYNIYRGGTKVGTSPSPSYTDSGLTANTTYSYTVSAYDPVGNSSAQSSALMTATNPPVDTTPPTVPAGLAKTGSTSSSITLGWTASTDPDSPVAGYNVYRGGTKVATTTTPSYTDNGLAVDTSYSYTVSAYDATGNTSAQSGALGASTSTCSISVATNTYTNYDGFITYQNKGSGVETDPKVNFTIPSGANLDKTGCVLSNQAVPAGVTAVTCSQSGTTITYAFTGSVKAGESIAIYYTTDVSGEAIATNIFVTASSCP